MMSRLPVIPVSTLVAYVQEDAPFGDVTSETVVPPGSCNAVIIAREKLVLAGLSEISALFTHYGVQTRSSYHDGDLLEKETVILSLSGPAHAILLVERTALNLLGRMSGIATRTREICEMVAEIDPDCRIAATRKTAPGLRLADKKAAMIGGADPHRFSLSDAVLIKDTHRALVPLGEAVRRARERGVYYLIEAEAESCQDAMEAVMAGADIILLDNMAPGMIRQTLDTLKTAGLREKVIVELSGGISPETIREYAGLGADRISLGMLTHTVRNADFSLEISPQS